MLTSHGQYQPKSIMSSSMATVTVLFQVKYTIKKAIKCERI